MLENAPIIANVPCVDLDGAKKFYGGVLGLKEQEMPGLEEMSATAAWYQCGGGTSLFVYKRETPTTADHTVAGWIVPDVEDIADQLIARGVKFEIYDMPDVEFDERGVASMSGSKTVWFKDPEGNILSISSF